MIWTFDCQTRRPLSNPLIISGKPSTVGPYSLGHMVHIETERWRNPNKKAPADMFGNVVDWAFPCMYVFKSLFPSSSKTRQVGWGESGRDRMFAQRKGKKKLKLTFCVFYWLLYANVFYGAAMSLCIKKNRLYVGRLSDNSIIFNKAGVCSALQRRQQQAKI